jgi:hypothetical protein
MGLRPVRYRMLGFPRRVKAPSYGDEPARYPWILSDAEIFLSCFRVFGVFRGSLLFGDKSEYVVAAPLTPHVRFIQSLGPPSPPGLWPGE